MNGTIRTERGVNVIVSSVGQRQLSWATKKPVCTEKNSGRKLFRVISIGVLCPSGTSETLSLTTRIKPCKNMQQIEDFTMEYNAFVEWREFIFDGRGTTIGNDITTTETSRVC